MHIELAEQLPEPFGIRNTRPVGYALLGCPFEHAGIGRGLGCQSFHRQVGARVSGLRKGGFRRTRR